MPDCAPRQPEPLLQDMSGYQTTLARPIYCEGVGLHSGQAVRLTLLPAPSGSGISFQRIDLPGQPLFRLTPETIVDTTLATVAASPTEAACQVATIEHLLAALHGLEVDNVRVQLNARELPILDGCARAFAFLIECAGLTTQEVQRQKIEILRPVHVQQGSATATLKPLPPELPTAQGLYLSLSIAFPQPVIGAQSWAMYLERKSFLRDIASSRTFVAHEEIAALQAKGLARGGSLENALVVQQDRVLNPGGTHGPDEFVRHKVLDAIGDLYCGGFQLIGAFKGERSGHALNNQLLRTLLSDSSSWRFVTNATLSTPDSKRGMGSLPLPRLNDIRQLWSAAS